VGVGGARTRHTGLLLACIVGAGSASLGLAVAHTGSLRAACAAALILAAVGLGLRRPDHLLYGLIVWLAVLGLVRRLLSQLSPFDLADPLLVVAPVALGVLVLKAGERGGFRNRSLLAGGVAVMSLLITVGALNPLQPSLAAGVGGLLFLLVPLLAFWVGRVLPPQVVGRAFKLVAVMAIPAAVYGLVQTVHGFPPWDAAWVQTLGYRALNVGGVVRPFGSFSSAAEYASFLAIGTVVVVVFWLRPATAMLALLAAGVLGVSIVVEASRNVIVLLLVGLTLVAAARLRLAASVSALALVAVLLGVVVLSRYWAPARSGTGARDEVSTLVAHSLSGLANPLDARSSTLPTHIGMVSRGLLSPLSYPLGQGPAMVTIAPRKLGGPQTASEPLGPVAGSTEADPSNLAVALGLPGLVLYLVIAATGLRAAYRLACTRRDAVALACLGVLGVTLLQWFNGGQYAVAPLPWLALGYVDASCSRPARGGAAIRGSAGSVPAGREQGVDR
jgi:hypothetical protein